MSLLTTTSRTAAAPHVIARGLARSSDAPPRRWRIVARVFIVASIVALVVLVAGGLVARQLAESEAVRDATVRTDSFATEVVQPALRDGVTGGDRAAVSRLDAAVRTSVHASDIARIKIWSDTGTIVYSDEPRLIGARYGLDDEERETLESHGTEAEVSDLDEPENRFERGHGPLLEVYRSVHTPNGTPLLFEVYYSYDEVLTSSEHIWTGFAAVIAASVLLFLLALLPLLIGLVRTIERTAVQREAMLRKALDASDAERRRIAGAVHDGPIQDLVGVSYQLGAAAAEAHGTEVGVVAYAAETTVRASIEGLREMLVELYPASLTEAGVVSALADLVAAARGRGAIVVFQSDDDLQLTPDTQQLIFRVGREALQNAVKHAGGEMIVLLLRRKGATTTLSIADKGPGFDVVATLANPPAGHFGLRLLQDAVEDGGVNAVLTVTSAPGAGTQWSLAVRD